MHVHIELVRLEHSDGLCGSSHFSFLILTFLKWKQFTKGLVDWWLGFNKWATRMKWIAFFLQILPKLYFIFNKLFKVWLNKEKITQAGFYHQKRAMALPTEPETLCRRLTIRMLSSHKGASIAWLTGSPYILSSNSKLVVLAFFQVGHFKGSLCNRLFGDFGPAWAEFVLAFDGVACDRSAAIWLGRRPGQGHGAGCCVRYSRSAWRTGNIW